MKNSLTLVLALMCWVYTGTSLLAAGLLVATGNMNSVMFTCLFFVGISAFMGYLYHQEYKKFKESVLEGRPDDQKL